MIMGIIVGIIATVFICFAFYIVSDGDFDGLLPLIMLLSILFSCGVSVGQETKQNITKSNIETYTYQCQICEETTTQTDKPQIMICDDCKEAIKNIKK